MKERPEWYNLAHWDTWGVWKMHKCRHAIVGNWLHRGAYKLPLKRLIMVFGDIIKSPFEMRGNVRENAYWHCVTCVRMSFFFIYFLFLHLIFYIKSEWQKRTRNCFGNLLIIFFENNHLFLFCQINTRFHVFKIEKIKFVQLIVIFRVI